MFSPFHELGIAATLLILQKLLCEFHIVTISQRCFDRAIPKDDNL